MGCCYKSHLCDPEPHHLLLGRLLCFHQVSRGSFWLVKQSECSVNKNQTILCWKKMAVLALQICVQFERVFFLSILRLGRFLQEPVAVAILLGRKGSLQYPCGNLGYLSDILRSPGAKTTFRSNWLKSVLWPNARF